MICKFLFIVTSGIIFWQDAKDRLVYWFLYPLLALLSFLIHLQYVDYPVLFITVLINIAFVSLLLVLTWSYYKLRKRTLVNKMIGIGDVALFFCLTPTLPAVSFITMFVFSLVFSLIVHQFLKPRFNDTTIPLAGYMVLYFSALYIVTFYFGFTRLFPA